MVDINAAQKAVYDMVGILYAVHNELGPGLSERVYQEGVKRELELRGIPFQCEQTLRPMYKGAALPIEFRLDIIANGIILELKAVERLTGEHQAQLFNYMHLYKPVAGILVNFAKRSCVLERYLYNPDTHEVLTYSGAPVSSSESRLRQEHL